MDLPPGFTDSPPSTANPLPQGFSEQPPPTTAEGLPEGFSASPPPPGFSFDNPVAPEKKQPAPAPPPVVATPEPQANPFWESLQAKMAATGDTDIAQQKLDSAFTPPPGPLTAAAARGTGERIKADIAGAKVLAGNATLEEQYQQSLQTPPVQDEINTLLGQKLSEGWANPKWWGVQIAHGTGSMLPGLGAAAIGGIGGTPGVVGAFGAEGALGTLVPAYIGARSKGLSEDDALHQAIVDSGISAATAGAMAVAPGISVFGKVQNPAVLDQVATVLKRPISEAMVQMGLIQPSLAVAGAATTTISHGETPTADDLLTDFATGVGMGAVPVGAHAVMRGLKHGAAEGVPASEAPLASPAEVQQSFENQNPLPMAEKTGVVELSTPEPDLHALEDTIYPREQRIFYSPVTEAIRTKLPESASVEQVISTLRNHPGVKEEELLDLNLPNYLADQNGRVNKADLLAHVESNGMVLEEVRAEEPYVMKVARAAAEQENGRGSWERIGGGGQEHYIRDARRTVRGGMVGTLHELERQFGINHDLWPPEATQKFAEVKADTKALLESERLTEYAAQVMPGPHSNYREFILKVPERGPRQVFDDPMYDPNFDRGEPAQIEKPNPDKNYNGPHFTDVTNPIAHFRLTDRSDRDGRTLLHVEEIQSDLHQEGRKKGYKDPNAPPLDEAHSAVLRHNEEFDRFMREHGAKAGESSYDAKARLDAMPEYQKMMADRKPLWDAYMAAQDADRMVPDLPFKSTWPELVVKRILRLAADEGYDGVSWTNGDQVGLRQMTPEQLAGSREFYNKIIPRLFQKWAKKLGMDGGTTKLEGAPEGINETIERTPTFARSNRIDMLREMGLHKGVNDRNGYVGVNPAAGSRIRQGLPLYEEGPTGRGQVTINDVLVIGLPDELKGPAKRIGTIMRSFAKRLDISKRLEIRMEPTRSAWRGRAEMEGGKYRIRINTNRVRTAEDLYATAAHELGHIVMWDQYGLSPDKVKTAVFNEFNNFRDSVNAGTRNVGDLRRLRDNAISEMTGSRNLKTFEGVMQNDLPLSDLTPRSRAYMLHFNEWFAEQVAKWATTSERPLGLVDKWFKTLGRKIRDIVAKFRGLRSESPEAISAIQGWLDSKLDVDPKWSADIKDKLALDTTRRNADALAKDGTPEVPASAQTASTGGGRDILASLPPDARSGGPATVAHADRMNKFYEWMTSLPQIAALNPHIKALQQYKEIVALMNLEKNNIMGDAWETLRSWKAIRDPKQLFGLNKFIEDYANGFFKQVNDGVIRRPNQAEHAALAAKHKLSGQSLRMFDKLVQDFDGFLEQYRRLLLADAQRIKDPQAQIQAIQDANTRVDGLLQRPFFPLTRYGKYTITVYDSKGNIKHFEQADSLRKQAQIAKVLEKSVNLLPGDRVRTGEVPKDAAPLLGMPPGFIDLVADKLNLSGTQRQMLDQLRFDYAPSQSFRHQFRNKDVTPGYSTDFQRNYAHFFFHGANHMTRVKWVDALRDQIKEVKAGSVDLNDAVKRDRVANYMTQHLDMLVDPKPDFAALRGLMFHWFLGFNPASASLNLTQTPLMTYPHLASHFGDLRSIASITRAGVELNNFYRKGTLKDMAKSAVPGPEGAKSRALGEAVREGVISETQAHTLAAVSEDRNLLKAFGTKAEEGWNNFSNASSWMFEMTEQYNRRVAFRAAWELTMRDPNNKYVQGVVGANPLQYKRLRDKGWSHQEAAAFTAAKDSVEKTQFVYAPYARAKFMWGRRGAIFIFKSFVQNTLFNLWANPSMAARHLVIMGALGGLMGLPGVEDVVGLLKGFAYRLFGKDFDLEDEVRKFAVDVLHGTISPDMLLHGTSVHGFGIPHVLNAIGAHVGLNPKWFPTLDRSRSISMGNILPVEPGKLLGPTKNAKGAELAQLQRASGAGFGNAFALYNFLNSEQDIGALKRWEGIMPRAFANVSHAFRLYHEGGEKNAAGNKVVKFDVGDTEQMSEILARVLGYQPRRITAKWESIGAAAEQAAFWDLRRGVLLRQFGEAVKGGNPEDKGRVLQAIRAYNTELPPEAKPKVITSEALKTSVQNRIRVKTLQESGQATAKSNRLIQQKVDQYYPEGRPPGQIDARPVR